MIALFVPVLAGFFAAGVATVFFHARVSKLRPEGPPFGGPYFMSLEVVLQAFGSSAEDSPELSDAKRRLRWSVLAQLGAMAAFAILCMSVLE